MKSVDLLAILDFLYCGEANVFQESLDSFLAIAEELQLKGLMGKVNEKADEFGVQDESPVTTQNPAIYTNLEIPKTNVKGQRTNRQILKAEENGTLAIPVTGNLTVEFEDLEDRVRSLMAKSENNYANGQYKADICKVCGKEGKGSAIKDHIEANHLEGIVLPCNLCDKTFRSRNGLRRHKCVLD